MVTSKGINWPQIRDAEETLVKLFNVEGIPSLYLVDRDGRIAAKRIPAEQLGEMIADLLRK
jgi:hypothetical protein